MADNNVDFCVTLRRILLCVWDWKRPRDRSNSNVTNLKAAIIQRRLIVSIIRSMDRSMNVSHRVKSDHLRSPNRRARMCSRKLAWLMKELWFPASAFGVQLLWFVISAVVSRRWVQTENCELLWIRMTTTRADGHKTQRRPRRFWSEFTRVFVLFHGSLELHENYML